MAKATPRSKCLTAIQKLARISSADDNGYCNCVSCGLSFHYKEGDGGHFIAKGNCSYWALELENIHFQCKGCNGFGMKYGIAAYQYQNWMNDYYGKDFVDNMFATKNNVRKLYKADYVEMLAEFNELIRFHEDRVGV